MYQDGGDPTGEEFFNNLLDVGMQQTSPDEENVSPHDEELSSDFIQGLQDYTNETDNTDLHDQINELRDQLKLQQTEKNLDDTQQSLENQLVMAQFYQTPEGEDELLGKYEPQQTSSYSDAPRYIPTAVGPGTNNVGNLRNPTTGKFQSFATPEGGEQALLNQLNMYQTGRTKNTEKGTKKRINGTTTLLDAMKVYAPSSDHNNPTAYAKFIANRLGVTVDTRIGDIDTKAWANAIKIMEGNTKITGKRKQSGGYSATFKAGRLGAMPHSKKQKYMC